MAFNIEPISLAIGAGLALIIWFIIFFIFKLINKRKEKNEPEKKTSLPTLKNYVKEAHNHMVESANNLIKLYEVFNEIDESKQ